MPIYFDKKRQSYRWEFRRIINGREIKRRKRLVPGISRVEAEKFARDEEARIFKIAAGIERPEELIADALAEYLSKRKFKDSTIPEGIALMLPYIEGKTISQFPDVVKEYQDDNPQHSPATQRNRIGYIRAGLRWCWRHQVITAQVPPVVIPNPNNQRHNYLLLSEQQKLLDCIVDVEAKALFTLTFWTGCRWEMEILTLSRESIITNGEDVFIDIGVTKNGRRKRKYVREEARWCLSFIPWNHARTWYYRRFNAARDKAGLSGYRIHDMRHSLASEIISNGGTLSDVGAVLGHESHQSSARYAHLYPERQMEVLKKVGSKK